VSSFREAIDAALQSGVPPEAILAVDESPINGNGGHMESEEVIYEIEQRAANEGAARSSSCSSGKRISAFQTISAGGHHYPPGVLVMGGCHQAAWTAAPYPEGVTEATVRNMTITPAPNGVQTTESFLAMFEQASLIPARKRVALSQKLLVVMDCDSTHGVDLKNGECSKELAALCLLYNAELVPAPANTSTHLSPLDVAFFGTWKGYVRGITRTVASIWSDDDAAKGISLHPRRLQSRREPPDLKAMTVRPKLHRAQGMKAQLGPRTHIMAFCLISEAKRVPLENAARESFKKPGIFPYSPEKMLAIVGDRPEPPPPPPGEAQPRASPRIEQRSEADAVRLQAIAYLQNAAGRGTGEIHRAFDVAVAAIEQVETVALRQRRLAACTMGEAEPEKTKRNTKYKGTQYFSANVLQEITERGVTLKQQKADEEKAERAAAKEVERGTRERSERRRRLQCKPTRRRRGGSGVPNGRPQPQPRLQ